MARLSLSGVWKEAIELVKREARLLFPIAFLLLALPRTMLQALNPQVPGQPAPPPEPWMAALGLPVLAVSVIGSLSLSYLMLRPGASGGEALRLGLRRMPAVAGAVLLIALTFLLVAVPLLTIAGVRPDSGPPGPAAALLFLVLFAAMLAVSIRLMLITPAAAVEPLGPVALIKRSWTLTGPVFWRLLGFMLLLILLAVVVFGAASLAGGVLILLLAGSPMPGSISSFLVLLLSAAMHTVAGVYFFAFLARIYAQRAGPSNLPDVFA